MEIITFDEIVNMTWQMRRLSLAREPSGTIKEILRTAQSMGCKVVGRHPHDIMNDISSGEAGCSASEELWRKIFQLKVIWQPQNLENKND